MHEVSIEFERHKYPNVVWKAFWNEFPTGRMDKKGFVKYYQEIKDEADTTGILCESVHLFMPSI